MTWIGALKKWNDGSPCWCVPRKGTTQHADVKAIMNKKIEAMEAKAEVAKAMKIPMEPQRKSISESNVPKATFHEPAPKKKMDTGRRMEHSIFKDIVRMAGEMDRAEEKETSNGLIEEGVPDEFKQLKVGDTLCGWFITHGTTWGNSKEFYKIVSIHNHHSTFKVESDDGEKTTLRLSIYRESRPELMDGYLYSYVLSDGWPYYVQSNYVPTKRTSSSSEINKAYEKWTETLQKESWFGPRMERLYEDMKKRRKIDEQKIRDKRGEETRKKLEKEKQEAHQKIKSMIGDGGLQKLKKEDLKKILNEYQNITDPYEYMKLWEQHAGTGYYSKTLPSKEKMIALIGVLERQ